MDIACKNSGSFAEAMNDVASTISKLQLHADENFTKNSEEDFIRDPLVVKSKGAPKTRNTKFKQIRRCSNCGVIGHCNRSCPNYDGPSQDGSLTADGRVKSSNPSSATFTEQRRKRKVSNVLMKTLMNHGKKW
ncbi:hypothetical protein PIB30_043324 [Stylosanthes scabra]|uniref:CCHC-type domain-containing protein n=1 Tax=Stylosanthes scabra TaxID=79078 RepID=A0ABU6SFN5_9FABA|nr:hypothetical protein [Stylosanthes scabra]